ncbi:hypothetical protein L1F30_15020 [Simiduia sp. 21SJ11W-1]|uniref:DUF6933 domain-containing protein n=1 Tax=Simiduia sp. 21SJ11W-1 TaxID=2909669 RepID=UPI0020A1CF47|nr:hypothetical protein [Simiduia sp. 21SJ11W-1]UTA47459.1 hypothetical protein L1F30_15020 [Simiduia sp. 21SJ11W-1]
MLTLHPTKALVAKLPASSGGQVPLDESSQWLQAQDGEPSPLSGWQGHLFTLQRQQCVLLVHQATRFPVLLKQLTKPDFARFHWHFVDGLMNTLLKCGATDAQMTAATHLLQPLQLAAGTDRSVQSTLNQMKGEVEHLLHCDQIALGDLAVYRVSARLAHRPTSVQGQYIWPDNLMLALLDAHADKTPENVVQLGDYTG